MVVLLVLANRDRFSANFRQKQYKRDDKAIILEFVNIQNGKPVVELSFHEHGPEKSLAGSSVIKTLLPSFKALAARVSPNLQTTAVDL